MKRKIINYITAVAVISAVIVSASFVSSRVRDYKNMNEALSSSVTYVDNSLPQEQKSKKYEQIISEKKNNYAEEIKIETKEPEYILPAEGEIISGYSQTNIIYLEETGDYRVHQGIDIKTDGKGVKAIADGIIYDVYEDLNNNYILKIQHKDIMSIYKNIIINSDVVVGKKVKKGDNLGKGTIMQSGAEYVHFEVEKDGKNENPIKYFE